MNSRNSFERKLNEIQSGEEKNFMEKWFYSRKKSERIMKICELVL